MKLNQLTLALCSTFLLGSSLVAQQPVKNGLQNPQAQTNQRQAVQGQILPGQTVQGTVNHQQQADRGQTKDQTFAECLAIANKEQVAIARFAKENATTDEVKEFAATL